MMNTNNYHPVPQTLDDLVSWSQPWTENDMDTEDEDSPSLTFPEEMNEEKKGTLESENYFLENVTDVFLNSATLVRDMLLLELRNVQQPDLGIYRDTLSLLTSAQCKLSSIVLELEHMLRKRMDLEKEIVPTAAKRVCFERSENLDQDRDQEVTWPVSE